MIACDENKRPRNKDHLATSFTRKYNNHETKWQGEKKIKN
jgi:hypothetical protein